MIKTEFRADTTLLSFFDEEEYVNPHEFVDEYKKLTGRSRATFYRRLEELKQLKLIEWRQGKAKLTVLGKRLLDATLDEDAITEIETYDHEKDFRILDYDELLDLDNDFIFLTMPNLTALFKKISAQHELELKGVTAEKLEAVKNSDIKLAIAIANFDHATKQFLLVLQELIRANKVKKLYISLNKSESLKKKELLEFLKEHDFESEEHEIQSVNLFPLLLIIVIAIIVVLLAKSKYMHASIASIMLIVYFMRSMLFRELRKNF